MYTYMLVSFDVGIMYLLNVDKCMHLIIGGTHCNFIRFYYGVVVNRLLEVSTLKMVLLLIVNINVWSKHAGFFSADASII